MERKKGLPRLMAIFHVAEDKWLGDVSTLHMCNAPKLRYKFQQSLVLRAQLAGTALKSTIGERKSEQCAMELAKKALNSHRPS